MGRLSEVAGRILSNDSGQDVPLPRKVLELAYVYARTGLGPGYYFEAGLSRRDRDLGYKLGFYGHRDYLKRLDELNDPRYGKLSQNKLAEAALLTAFGIPTPRLIGHLSMEAGLDVAGKPLRTGCDLHRVIEEQGVDRFVAKTVEGWSGKGFVGAEVVRNGALSIRLLDSGETLDCGAFVERFGEAGPEGGRILQHFLVQHPTMAAINPSSVNTIRMLAVRPHGGAARFIGGYARVGRDGCLVDNTGSGGFWSVVEPATGRLAAGRRADPYVRYAVHPDHGAAIEGVVVPFWREAKALACRVIDVFPSTRYLGLDVAIAPEGPVVIEVNNRPDYHGYAVLQIPTRQALKD